MKPSGKCQVLRLSGAAIFFPRALVIFRDITYSWRTGAIKSFEQYTKERALTLWKVVHFTNHFNRWEVQLKNDRAKDNMVAVWEGP